MNWKKMNWKFTAEKECDECKGTGYIHSRPSWQKKCMDCKGTGIITGTFTVDELKELLGLSEKVV